MKLGRVTALVVAVAATAAGPLQARAEDPVPPITILDWIGPNVPIWQTFGLRAVEGSAPVDHFECHLDDAPWETCTSPWDPELTGGTHTVHARAVDVDGLADPTPEEATFFVDVEGPVPTLAINGGATVTGRYLVRLDVAGTEMWAGTQVLVSNSGQLDADGRLASAWSGQLQGLINGRWGWHLDNETYGGSATPGVHTVYIQAVDVFSNWGPVVAASVTVDPTVKPSATIRLAASQNPAPVGDRVILLALAEASDGAPIEDGTLSMWLDGGDGIQGQAIGWVAEEVGAMADASRLEPGEYAVKATFTGSSDLLDGATEITLKVGPALGITTPYAFFSAPSPYPSWDTPGPFTLGIDSRYGEAVSFECRIDEAPWASCSGSLEVPEQGPGSHTAEVRGTDRGGRVQAVPEMFTWRSTVGTAGAWWLLPQGGFTRDPAVELSLQGPSGALAIRLSNSRAVDTEGRLANAKEIAPPPGLSPFTPWSLVDPAYGGTDADGHKLVWIQWQLADASWTVPELAPIVLDRVAPELTLRIEAGSPFVDRDKLLVLAKTDGPATILVTDDPAEAAAHTGGGTTVSDGLGFIAWPIDVPLGTVAEKTLYATARDGAGNWSDVVEASITIDRTSPVTQLRPLAFVKGSRVGETKVRAWVRATATDSGSGVRSLALQELTGSAVSTIGSATAGSIRIQRTLPFSSSRRYRSRGIDRLGHVGAWTTGAAVRPVLRDDRSSTISWSGRWWISASSSALGVGTHRASRAGATATFRFTGRAVALVAPRAPLLGKADILVDGVNVATVDLRSSASKSRVIAFARSWSTSGSHTVVVRVRGTAGRPTVAIDGFVVLP